MPHKTVDKGSMEPIQTTTKSYSTTYRLAGWSMALLGLGFWALAGFGFFMKWYWSESATLTDLGLLVVCVASGGLLIRGAQDVYRRLKAKNLDLPETLPENTDAKLFKTNLNAKLVLTVTDAHGYTADPFVHVHEVYRDVYRGQVHFWLVGVINLGGKKRQPCAISTASLTKIKDVETNAVIHEGFRKWISQRLDGWTED
ncbi:MAG: hypothetical protein ACPGVN_01590 [Alphaproteobacteria bacterium]